MICFKQNFPQVATTAATTTTTAVAPKKGRRHIPLNIISSKLENLSYGECEVKGRGHRNFNDVIPIRITEQN